MSNSQFFSIFLQNNQKQIDSVRKRLKACPPGDLYVQEKNGKAYYIQIITKGGERSKFGINKNPELINGLLRKRLLKTELDARLQRQAAVKDLEGNWPEFDLQNEIEKIQAKFPSISNEMISNALHKEGHSWADQEYEQSDYKSEERRQINSHGLKLRSKSEILITEKFYEYGIQFRYEQAITIKKTKLIPDFTIMREDGKIFYWEHEGLTNSSDYLNWQLRKSQLYASVNIVPWDNLIVTYDKPDGIIDIRIVESEIKNKLLL